MSSINALVSFGSQSSFLNYNKTYPQLTNLKLETRFRHVNVSINTDLSKLVLFSSIISHTAIESKRNVLCMVSDPEKETFYDLLEISENSSFSEIKKAYKNLAKKYHPDLAPIEKVKDHMQKFIHVKNAYETLSNPTKRAFYDTVHLRGRHHPTINSRRCITMEEARVQLDGLKRRSMSKSSRNNRMSHMNAPLNEELLKENWQSQLEELKRRRMRKASDK
ncbi:hypothetical protein ACFE04_001933 [Oxalis oulophora]